VTGARGRRRRGRSRRRFYPRRGRRLREEICRRSRAIRASDRGRDEHPTRKG
jgi:hypothetical protein